MACTQGQTETPFKKKKKKKKNSMQLPHLFLLFTDLVKPPPPFFFLLSPPLFGPGANQVKSWKQKSEGKKKKKPRHERCLWRSGAVPNAFGSRGVKKRKSSPLQSSRWGRGGAPSKRNDVPVLFKGLHLTAYPKCRKNSTPARPSRAFFIFFYPSLLSETVSRR